METVKGYKAFESDWTCRGKKYTCPGVFEDCAPEDLKICSKGIHFCERLIDCFAFYNFSEQTKIAEVEALGMTLSDGTKTCTNEIHIIREVPWSEVLKLVNTGKDNTGKVNSGNRNSGNWNSGNRNSGDCNSGNCNSGNRNSGDCNSGDYNSGYWNSGNWNSGDWNSGNCNSGCFNTETPKILLFNKPSEWTIRDWDESIAYRVMSNAPSGEEWISYNNMTDKERDAHPEAKAQRGYLRSLDYEDLVAERNKWWHKLSDEDKQAVLSLPNFDANIFRECTLIEVDKEDDSETL